MIFKFTSNDFQEIFNVVNEASVVYKGKIPIDRWREPYMPLKELEEEIACGVKFYGLKQNGVLAAVMGMQSVKDVTLIRHAYVLSSYQRQGLGETLLNHLLALAKTSKVYVGTWKAATWAIKFYQKNGFELVSTQEKNKLLKKYWSIPDRQVETSVVLELKRQLR